MEVCGNLLVPSAPRGGLPPGILLRLHVGVSLLSSLPSSVDGSGGSDGGSVCPRGWPFLKQLLDSCSSRALGRQVGIPAPRHLCLLLPPPPGCGMGGGEAALRGAERSLVPTRRLVSVSWTCRLGPEVRVPPKPAETTGPTPPRLPDGRCPAEAAAKVPGLQRPCLSIPVGRGRRATCMPVPCPHWLCSQPSASRAEGRWRVLPGDRAGSVSSFVFRATGATSQCGHYRAVTACGCMTMGAYVQFADSGQISARAAAAHTRRPGA